MGDKGGGGVVGGRNVGAWYNGGGGILTGIDGVDGRRHGESRMVLGEGGGGDVESKSGRGGARWEGARTVRRPRAYSL